jgi:CubicO group peptidase (beta-lactamase class C family)
MRPHVVAIAALGLLAACSSQSPATDVQRTSEAAPDSITVDPALAGWNAAALQDVVAYVQGQKSTGLLIIDDGRIVSEHNWPLPPEAAAFAANFTHGTSSDGALIEDVASAQKSFIALLAAIAIDRRLLDIEKPVTAYLGVGWSQADAEQERGIKVRNLLEMDSGLSEKLDMAEPVGVKFFYNTPAYALMKPILEKASGRTLDEISRDWLILPAGLRDTSWAKRPAAFADVGNPTGLATTPRDLAKLGQLFLDDGRSADGGRVVSEKQLKALFQRSANNPAYGRLWWLNGSKYTLRPGANAPRSETALIPAAPADLVAALGAQDRKLYIVPSRRLLVVRMGQAAPDRDFDQQVWLRLMKAAPAS